MDIIFCAGVTLGGALCLGPFMTKSSVRCALLASQVGSGQRQVFSRLVQALTVEKHIVSPQWSKLSAGLMCIPVDAKGGIANEIF